MTHKLKTIQPYFDEVKAGRKTHELRKNDREFEVGDYLLLCEWTGDDFTGRTVTRRVTHIVLEHESLTPGYCCMSLAQQQAGGSAEGV